MSFLTESMSNPRIRDLAAVLAVIVVILIMVQLVRRFLIGHIREPDTRYRMRKFVNFLGYILVFLVALSIFSDSLRGLAVALGVAGAGIAFSLQEVIASVAGWMAISLGRFYRTGDRVMVGGIKGDVIDIGVLRTTVMEIGQWVAADQYNGRIVRVANSFIFKEPVFNYSGDFPFLWDEVVVPIRYGSDHELARQMLQRVAEEVVGGYTAFASQKWKTMVEKYFIEDASVAPAVMMTASENWMDFAVRYVVDYKKRRLTKDQLFRRILDEVAASEGRISIAASSLELTAMPAVEVRLRGQDSPQTAG